MPMIRYQIRNEYGLADPELHRAADRDDPEALLEGVAMAGLVGVLRQLGDLAEFAAEIFHELHEEVMVTAARGHGLVLRVQQLEVEFPSIEKALLCQTSHSRFAYNAGIDWHANLRSDENLITREDMPRFILDSYEECRGPPRLFMLDKFDVAGAGACLTRYSDPSFFKTKLASSGIIEVETKREKKARKIKKKASHWRNNEVVESSLAPHINLNLQPGISEQVHEKNPTRRVKLKSRHFNGMETGRNQRYMESLLEVHSSEQKVLWENSNSQSIKSIDSSDLARVHEIFVDNSNNYSSFKEREPSQDLSKQNSQLPTNERENHKINGEEFFETLPEPFNEVHNMYSTVQIVEKKEMAFNSDNKTIISADSNGSIENEKNTPSLQLDQKKVLTEADCITGRFSDGCRSDDVGSEVDGYMDALNTLELEIETDSEIRAKLDPAFNMKSQRVHTSEGQQKFPPQFSEPGYVVETITPLGLKNMFREEMSSLSVSDNIGTLAGTQPPQQNMISLDVPADSEICIGKTHDKASDELHQSDEVMELKSSDGSCNAEASDIPNFRPEIGEASTGSCATNFSLIHVHSQGNFEEAQLTTPDTIEMSSCYVKGDHTVAEPLDDNLPCMTGTNEAKQMDGSSLGSGDGPGGTHPVEKAGDIISEDMAATVDMPNHISQKQDENTLQLVSAGYVEDLLQELKESRNQEAEACPSGSLSLTTSVPCPDISSVLPQPDGLAEETESPVQPEDLDAEVSSGCLSGTLEVNGHLSGLSCGGRVVPEKTPLTEDSKDIEDMADTHDMFYHIRQTQNGIVLENIPAEYVKDSPLSLTMCIGEPLQSIEQEAEVCSSGRISPTRLPISLVSSHISVQPADVDAELDNYVAYHEELGMSQSADNTEIADDIIASKILLPNILPLELEQLSDEGPCESCNVELKEFIPDIEITELIPLYSGKETDDIKLHSNCEVKDESLLGDEFRWPSGSIVSEAHKDASQIEQTMQCDNSSTKSVTDKGGVDYNESTPLHAPELSGFHVQSQEDFVHDDAYLNQHKLDINELSSSINTTVLHSENTVCICHSPLVKNILVSAPAVSSSELAIVDSSYSSETILSNGVCQTMPYEHTETDLPRNIDEESLAYSSESGQDLNSKASLLCIQESVKEDLPTSIQPAIQDEIASIQESEKEDSTASIQPAIPVEVPSIVQADVELNMISSHQESVSVLQFEIAGPVEHDITQINPVEHNDKPSGPGSEQDPHVVAAAGDVSELDIAQSNTGIHGQPDGEASIPSECSSENTISSVSPDISSSGLPLIEGFGLAFSESTPQHGQPAGEASVPSECSSENTISSVSPNFSSSGLQLIEGFGLAFSESTPQQSSEPSISDPVPSFQFHDVQEAPSLPPLPPLEWRMGKLRLGSLTSNENLAISLTGTDLFSASSTTVKNHTHGLVTDEAEMAQPTNLFAPLPALEENQFQCGLFSSVNERVQPLRLSELPPIVEDKGYQHDSQGEMVHPLNPSSFASPLDVDRHLYSHDALLGGMLKTSNTFVALLDDEGSLHLHQLQGEKVKPLEDKRPQLGQLLPALELERSRHDALSIEREMVQSVSPLLVELAAENQKYQSFYGVYGGENLQHLSLPAPVPDAGLKMQQYGFVSSREEDQLFLDDGIVSTMEESKPNGKLHSIRNRPRHPLIDAVAAHDKSKLRKVSELVQPSTKPNADERDTLLEQIRKKSFNLKPAAATKPNIKGPPTNLKVTAILEKANAIRQACTGSDEDDDADNWSDT